MAVFADGIFEQKFRRNLSSGVRFWKTFAEGGGDRVQLWNSLFESHVWFKPANARKTLVISPRKKIMIRAQIRQRNENIGLARKTNPLRNNADYFARNAIDIQTLTERERQCAEMISPELFADQRDFGCPRLVVFSNEIAPKTRRDLQDRQIICRDPRRANAFWWRGEIGHGKIDAFRPNECKISKAALLRAPIEIIRVTDRAGFESIRSGESLAQQNQLFRMGIRQWPQQDGVHHTKDGGVSANTERESEHSDSGKGRLLHEHPQGVTKILENGVHGSIRCATQLPDQRRWRAGPATSRQ